MMCEGPEQGRMDSGRLQAYLDGELAAEERRVVSEHLATCTCCQQQLVELQRQVERVSLRLTALVPQPERVPNTTLALAELRSVIAAARPSPWQSVTRRLTIMRQSLFAHKPQLRLAAVGLLTLVLFVGLFSIAPARQAMAQFLGIFRVRKFAVISVDQAQVDRLENLQDTVEAALGKPEFLREPGDPQPVVDVATAEAQAGFDVLEPAEMPEGSVLREVAVAVGPHVRMELDQQAMQTALAILGVEDATLPAVKSATLEADVPMVVLQEYYVFNPHGSRDAQFTIYQAPSPEVEVPAGIDPTAMGEILLQVLGMSPRDAQRLAQSIDWTTTLVVPFPAEMASAYELEVAGTPAVMVEQKPGTDGYKRNKVLIWQRNGYLYAVGSENMAAPAVLQVAGSLH